MRIKLRNANYATHTKPVPSAHLNPITNAKSATPTISGTNNQTPTAYAPANSATPNSITPASNVQSPAATSANKPTNVTNAKPKNALTNNQSMESANAKLTQSLTLTDATFVMKKLLDASIVITSLSVRSVIQNSSLCWMTTKSVSVTPPIILSALSANNAPKVSSTVSSASSNRTVSNAPSAKKASNPQKTKPPVSTVKT